MAQLYLTILRFEQNCVFKLSWGKGQQLTAQLPLSPTLMPLYQTWQQSYLQFYQSSFRARVVGGGSFQEPAVDWRVRLVQAEANLLSEFYRWLASSELFEVRQKIAMLVNEAQLSQGARPAQTVSTDLFLDCSDSELSRLPWESWELGREFASPGSIQIARTPSNIREETLQRRRHGKMRLLAILGDDTGLDFERDREAVRALNHLVEVQFVGWQTGREITAVKSEILSALEDERGWDILFFGGHSNESNQTGGELSIAPESTILLSEIESQLQIAKQNGLKFALFNSCKGLSIADKLIDLGLSQVAVMREPIHNQVAQEFLTIFAQALARYEDTQQALRSTCQSLKVNREITFPSAALVPSLFRHPDSTPFRLEAFGWRQQLRQWLPTKPEAIAITAFSLMSLLGPVQTLSLDFRVGLQAFYRQYTGRAPQAVSAPPVLLVQIDDASLKQAGVEARKRNPIDRSYLADVLNRVQTLEPTVVGVDYVLEDVTPEDGVLRQAIKSAVKANTKLVFASEETQQAKESGIHPTLLKSQEGLQGYIDWFYGYMELPRNGEDCEQHCPFAYVLALISQAEAETEVIGGKEQDGKELRQQLLNSTELAPVNSMSHRIRQTHFSGIARWAGAWGQPWLYPIWDLSLPPDLIYQRVMDGSLQQGELPDLAPQQVVLIAPGGYAEAGVDIPGGDNFDLPPALAYWHQQGRMAGEQLPMFTGAEAHAYMIHHLRERHFVWAVPSLWLIGIAAALAKGWGVFQSERGSSRRGHKRIAISYIIYGCLCLEVYISIGILLPFLLPSFSFYWLTKQKTAT